MPPCICTALWPQNLPDLPICTLAPEAALRRTTESLSSILSEAISVIERASWALVKQSTMRCCSTWNLPIGSAHSATMAWSTASSTTPKASSTLPSTASAPTETLSKVSSEARSASWVDRKSTRLNSSHITISYAVFCLKKKKKTTIKTKIQKKKKNNTQKRN